MVILLFLIVLLVYLLPTYPKPVVIENFINERECAYPSSNKKQKARVASIYSR